MFVHRLDGVTTIGFTLEHNQLKIMYTLEDHSPVTHQDIEKEYLERLSQGIGNLSLKLVRLKCSPVSHRTSCKPGSKSVERGETEHTWSHC